MISLLTFVSHRWAATAQAGLRICADPLEPLLIAHKNMDVDEGSDQMSGPLNSPTKHMDIDVSSDLNVDH